MRPVVHARVSDEVRLESSLLSSVNKRQNTGDKDYNWMSSLSSRGSGFPYTGDGMLNQFGTCNYLEVSFLN
jgi:hypothetical protein